MKKCKDECGWYASYKRIENEIYLGVGTFLDSLWFSIKGELNRNGYDAARKYVEEADLIVLR
ncbi:MAG: hypothetical protein EGP79_04285 [Roseburia intestinalis]|nr:hypothetical protein [Roseburia intestinalis]